MIKRALERFRYLVVLFSTTSPSFPYILLLITAIVVVLIGMIAYFFGLFSVQSIRASGIQAELDAGFFDSLWWSVKHVLDPGAFSENYGAPITITIFALFNTICRVGPKVLTNFILKWFLTHQITNRIYNLISYLFSKKREI